MLKQKSTECLNFQGLFSKPILMKFDENQSSSDGGALLLKAANQKIGLIESIAECIIDKRQASKVHHNLTELLSQRIFAIACGYADANDASRLASDPIHKLLANRDPLKGKDLASQPTLSRFENSINSKELYLMNMEVMRSVVAHHKKRLNGKARLITIDLDPTDDPTHGKQQLTFFNSYYDTYCYLPILCFMTFNDESEQYIFNSTLRPGNANAKLGAIGILKRTINELRKNFPKSKILVRLDGGFAAPEIYEFLESEKVEYVINIAKNSILKAKIEGCMKEVRLRSEESLLSEKEYSEFMYAAGTWKSDRRIIAKAEVLRTSGKDVKDNPRFLVTNMKQDPKYIYNKVYCKRGDAENRIKELLYGLALDRTSCTSFKANQLRVIFSTVAFILIQEIRTKSKGSNAASLQVTTIQNHLFKLSARVVSSVRRIVIHLPISFPYINEYKFILQAFNTSSA